MRFLLYNIRYATGTGAAFHLPVPGAGYLRTNPRVLDGITRFIKSQDPDIVGLIEVDTGSIRSRRVNQAESLGFEEDFLLLSKSLLLLYEQIQSQLARVPAAKASTREELFRRLELGREYIHSSAGGPLSLNSVAREACLSRYHFHRLFTQVFQKTPHGYLTEVRLARAHSLLRSGLTVDDVCANVGFSSTSSFGRLFRAQYGVSPGAVRKP